MNQSQAFSPNSSIGGPEPVTQMDIEREKEKIARALRTKEQ